MTKRFSSLAASVAFAALLGGFAHASEADAARLGADWRERLAAMGFDEHGDPIEQ